MPSGQSFNPMPMHIPFHDGIFPPMPRGHQVNLNYGHPLHPALSPFTTNPAGYTPWPNSPAMNYVQSLNGSDTNLFRFCSFTKLLFVFRRLVSSSNLSDLLVFILQASFCKQSLMTISVLSTSMSV